MSKHRRDEGIARSVAAYEVGYGKPPIATRFGVRAQPDRSKSSIAKAKSPALDIAALLDRPIQAKIDGRLKNIHPHEAMLHGLFKRGMEGEIRALHELIQRCRAPGRGSGLCRPHRDPSGWAHRCGASTILRTRRDRVRSLALC